jgi:hypothetical protein
MADTLDTFTEATAIGDTDLLHIKVGTGVNSDKKLTGANLSAYPQTLTNKTLNDLTNFIHADATHTAVRNTSGSLITKGTPVYISGWSVGESLITIAPADASAAATMPCLGLAEEDIANNANGAVIISGQIDGVDTSSWSTGDPLFVSETTGELTSTRPTGSALVQKLGIVLRSHATLGVLELVGAGRSNDIPNEMLDTLVRIVDDGDATKQIAFQASGITTANTRTITMADEDVDLSHIRDAVYNNQTGTTYTILASDNGKIITFNNAASIAVTLPDTLDVNFQCTIVQIGAGVPTVTPGTDTINGAGTGVAPSAQWAAMFLSQYSATNWLAII